MTAWPRLMRERTARRYLDGLDPFKDLGVTPEYRRGEPFFDRVAIDRAVDGKGGLTPVRDDDPDRALAAWREGHGPS